MEAEDVAKAFFHHVENGNLEAALTYLDESFQFYGPRVPPLTKTDYGNNLRAIIAAFDDWDYQAKDFRMSGDLLQVTINVTGVQNRPLAFPGTEEVPATGKVYRRGEEPLAFKIENDRIVEMHMTPSGEKAAIHSVLDAMKD